MYVRCLTKFMIVATNATRSDSKYRHLCYIDLSGIGLGGGENPRLIQSIPNNLPKKRLFLES